MRFYPSVKPYGLPAPLSWEPLLTPLQIFKKCLFIASPEKGGGPSKTVEGLTPEKWRVTGEGDREDFKSVSEADTTIPHS